MEKKKTFLVNVAYYGFFAVLIFLAARYLLPVLMPFLLALILAVLMQGPAGRIAGKLHCPKKPAAILLLILFYLLVFGVIFLCGGQAASAAGNFLVRLPGIYQNQIAPMLDSLLEELGNYLSGTGLFLADEIETSLQQAVQNLGQMISGVSMNLLSSLPEFVAGIPGAIVDLVTLIAMFAGLGLCGFPGLFLFPIAAVIFANMIKNGAIPFFGEKESPD